jgi:RecA-family ATPase
MFPDKTGVFVRINPMKPGGKCDDDVAAFRHCLVEFDLDENGNLIPLQTQFEIFMQSGLPITAVLSSGHKSLHAWVRLDALDRAEFDSRRAQVWQVFNGRAIDLQNKNPSRYSRAPGFERTLYDEKGVAIGIGKQELLTLGLGPANWEQWVLKSNTASFPEIVDGERIANKVLPLPPEIICGILSLGEKGELAGGSKSYKTWSLIHQALAIASGEPWWDFKTIIRNVIFLNLEIPQPYFEERVRTVADALGISIPKNFKVWHLRQCKLGDNGRWNSFLTELKNQCATIPNPYVTSDPIYKLLGGRNENSAGDVQLLLEQLEDMIQAVDGANFFGHHFSKGNQAGKEAIDRGAGSGVFQRDPDTIFTMTPHEKDGCFVVDAISRNHPPIDPFVVQWNYPLFIRDQSLDPGQLKQPRPKNQKRYDVGLLLKWLGTDCLKASQFCKLLMDEEGMSKATFYNLFEEAKKRNLIIFDGISKTWERTGNP